MGERLIRDLRFVLRRELDESRRHRTAHVAPVHPLPHLGDLLAELLQPLPRPPDRVDAPPVVGQRPVPRPVFLRDPLRGDRPRHIEWRPFRPELHGLDTSAGIVVVVVLLLIPALGARASRRRRARPLALDGTVLEVDIAAVLPWDGNVRMSAVLRDDAAVGQVRLPHELEFCILQARRGLVSFPDEALQLPRRLRDPHGLDGVAKDLAQLGLVQQRLGHAGEEHGARRQAVGVEGAEEVCLPQVDGVDAFAADGVQDEAYPIKVSGVVVVREW